MFSWVPYSLVRVAIVLIAGILLGIYWPGGIPETVVQILFIGSAGLFIMLAYFKFKGNRKIVGVGVIGLIAVLLAGYGRVLQSIESSQLDHFIHFTDSVQYYQAVVISQPQEKENSWKIEARVNFIFGKDWQACSGRVLLYLSKKSFDTPYHYGDVLLINGKPSELTEPANPAEFDYKRFLSFRKIYHQHFLREGDVSFIQHSTPNRVLAYSYSAQQWAAQALKRNIDGDQEKAVVSALVLGIKDGLDNELIGAYSASGAMHVLAVSGLHVGIIYALLLLVLQPLNRFATGKWAIAVISIFALWAYAFITGLSPSVLRAVTMFSFVAAAQPMAQRTNIYNTLAASAFCLLLWEPFLVMSVGFQLSFIAVLGIVYIQPKIYQMWNPQGGLINKVWQISCVSIAAQAVTFSLGLLYFHQFPVYFLVSNLFVIPGAFIILILGIGVILLTAIQPVAALFGFMLQWIVWGLNFLVQQVEQWPFSMIENVYITTAQCWMLLMGLLFIFLMIEFRKVSFAVCFSICVGLFGAIQWTNFFNTVNHSQLVVYKISNHSALEIIDRGQAYTFLDSTLMKDQERIRFHIRPNRLQAGVHQIRAGHEQDFVKNYPGCRLIVWRGISLLHVYKSEFSSPHTFPVDYLVISHNSAKNLSQVSAVKFRKLILDSSNSFYFANRLLQQAQKNSMDVYSVIHQGAYTTRL
jgi:competence protein ComEC